MNNISSIQSSLPRISSHLSGMPTQMATIAADLPGQIASILATCHQRIDLYWEILTWQNIGLAHLVGAIIYVFALITYRIYFSPIAAFPGPFLAKVTHWYEFYHNFIRTGMYYEEIRKMHEKYGMLYMALKTRDVKATSKFMTVDDC